MPPTAKPKLQLFVSDLTATGVVRNAIAIANRAAASGYAVSLLTCSADGALAGTVDPAVRIVELLGAADGGMSRRSKLKHVLLAYRRASREWRPDILLSAGNHGHLLSSFAWLGLPGAKLLRISNDLNHGTPSPLVRAWRTLKFRAMVAMADRLVLVSRALGASPLLAPLVASGKAEVIANGVDVEAVRAAAMAPCSHPWASDDGVPLILAIGRHVRQKNFPALIDAFALARARQPMRLMIIGEGELDVTARLAEQVQLLGVSGDVAFVPPVANPFPYIAAADALALPSLWEGSSNVLLEAMACGTPVVASRTAGDAAHVLAQGLYGVLADPADTHALAEALLTQCGPDARRPANRVQAFSRSAAMDAYLRLFAECVGPEQVPSVEGQTRDARREAA